MSLVHEFKRRNVIRVAGLYLVAAWLIVQVAGTVLPMFDAPAWLPRSVVIVLAIGFVPALICAWAFELTPEGLKRESDVDRSRSITPQTGRKLDRVIMVALALALGYFAFDKFVVAPRRAVERADSAREDGRTRRLVESYGDNSIAVLPFADLSPNKDQEYFSDGIAEELLNLLARVPELRVISRSSAFSYKGKDVRLAQMASELKIAHVLEGSVRKAGHRVRITAQLIDARSDTQLWSHTWDRDLDDIFAVQDEIAAAVVAQLKVTLQVGTAPKTTAVNPDAYALFLQARQLGRVGAPRDLEQASALLQQALRLDPDYASAWTELARVYISQVSMGLRPREEGIRLAREAVADALAADPDDAPAHGALGRMAMVFDWDLAAAARHYEHALALEPTDTEIIGLAARVALNLGRPDTALEMLNYAAARDGVNPSCHLYLGLAQLSAGRPDAAIASLRTALGLAPGRIVAHYLIGVALLQKGDSQAALLEMQQETERSWRLIGLTLAYHTLGRKAESDAALAEAIASYSDRWANNIAYALAWRNEPDRAFAWLDRAAAQRDPGLAGIASEPLFSNLRDDPRWLPFMRKLGKTPEQLAAIKFDVHLPQ